MEKTSENKRKKRALIIAALIAVPGLLIAGVFASNTAITLNGGSPLSLGAGYTTATSCDGAVDVAASQNYYATGSAFKVEEIRISNINEASSGCNLKTLTAVVVKSDGSVSTATWTLASTSATTNVYKYGLTSTSSGSNIYASSTLSPFALDQLATIAIGIS
jgi:hypothetical protein